MATVHDNGAVTESVALLLLALFLLTSPFALWWIALTPPWYLPYLIWLAIIALIALLARRMRGHEL
jgi:hypothetical protein